MKKYLGLLSTTILLLSFILVGCGNATDNGNQKTNEKSGKNNVSITNNDNRFIFTANEGGSISKISVKEQKVISTFKLDGAVHNIQVSPNGKVVGAVVVPEMGHGHDESMKMKGKAIFFDPKTNKVIKEVEVGNHPAHDLNTKQVTATIETGNGSHGVVTSPDNKYSYVTNMFADTVSVIDNSVNKVIKTINVGKTPSGISIMP